MQPVPRRLAVHCAASQPRRARRHDVSDVSHSEPFGSADSRYADPASRGESEPYGDAESGSRDTVAHREPGSLTGITYALTSFRADGPTPNGRADS